MQMAEKGRKNTHKKEGKRNVGKTDGETWLLDRLHMEEEPFKVAHTI